MGGDEATLLGALLVVLYTGAISSADGITKLLAQGYAAAQLYVLSGAVVALLCVLLSWWRPSRQAPVPLGAVAEQGQEARRVGPWHTLAPIAMALRSIAAVLAAVFFFYAFRLLPFAQVFLFIGLMPLLAGVLSGWILRERIAPGAWLALLAGFGGILFLFSGQGLEALSWGNLVALAGAFCGTVSMVLARRISRSDRALLPQVFFPNLALCLTMLPVLPFVWQDMPLADLGWALAYAVLLFAARWLAVAALRLLPAHVVTALMNLQFIWMLVIGALVFGESITAGIWAGGLIVIASGLYLLWQQMPARAMRKLPPEEPRFEASPVYVRRK